MRLTPIADDPCTGCAGYGWLYDAQTPAECDGCDPENLLLAPRGFVTLCKPCEGTGTTLSATDRVLNLLSLFAGLFFTLDHHHTASDRRVDIVRVEKPV